MRKISTRSFFVTSWLLFCLSCHQAIAEFPENQQEDRVIRRLLCTANAYGYEDKKGLDLVAEKLIENAAVQFLDMKVDEYIRTLIGSRSGINYIRREGQKLHFVRKGRIDGQLVGESLSGVRVGGYYEFVVENGNKENLLTVTANTGKSTFYEGDEVRFLLDGNQNFHACLVEKTPDDKVTQLLPNFFKPLAYFEKGQYLFPNPSAGDQFYLSVESPFGAAAIHLFSSELAIGGIPDKRTSKEYFVESNDSIDTIRKDIIDLLLEEMFAMDAAVTFQCFQFVEYEKSLMFKPAEGENSNSVSSATLRKTKSNQINVFADRLDGRKNR